MSSLFLHFIFPIFSDQGKVQACDSNTFFVRVIKDRIPVILNIIQDALCFIQVEDTRKLKAHIYSIREKRWQAPAIFDS